MNGPQIFEPPLRVAYKVSVAEHVVSDQTGELLETKCLNTLVSDLRRRFGTEITQIQLTVYEDNYSR